MCFHVSSYLSISLYIIIKFDTTFSQIFVKSAKHRCLARFKANDKLASPKTTASVVGSMISRPPMVRLVRLPRWISDSWLKSKGIVVP